MSRFSDNPYIRTDEAENLIKEAMRKFQLPAVRAAVQTYLAEILPDKLGPLESRIMATQNSLAALSDILASTQTSVQTLTQAITDNATVTQEEVGTINTAIADFVAKLGSQPALDVSAQIEQATILKSSIDASTAVILSNTKALADSAAAIKAADPGPTIPIVVNPPVTPPPTPPSTPAS